MILLVPRYCRGVPCRVLAGQVNNSTPPYLIYRTHDTRKGKKGKELWSRPADVPPVSRLYNCTTVLKLKKNEQKFGNRGDHKLVHGSSPTYKRRRPG